MQKSDNSTNIVKRIDIQKKLIQRTAVDYDFIRKLDSQLRMCMIMT